jgi:hypothetical protein
MPRPSAKRIAKVREKIDRIRQALGEFDTLCSGTLLTRMKVCGKPGCRCASDPSARHGCWRRPKTEPLLRAVPTEN